MFRTELLPIIRSLDTVFIAIGICHTIYVDCLLADSQHTYIQGVPGGMDKPSGECSLC